ncbi:hypothetical protein ACFSYD_22425 [Paracoccus aerius]
MACDGAQFGAGGIKLGGDFGQFRFRLVQSSLLALSLGPGLRDRGQFIVHPADVLRHLVRLALLLGDPRGKFLRAGLQPVPLVGDAAQLGAGSFYLRGDLGQFRFHGIQCSLLVLSRCAGLRDRCFDLGLVLAKRRQFVAAAFQPAGRFSDLAVQIRKLPPCRFKPGFQFGRLGLHGRDDLTQVMCPSGQIHVRHLRAGRPAGKPETR